MIALIIHQYANAALNTCTVTAMADQKQPDTPEVLVEHRLNLAQVATSPCLIELRQVFYKVPLSPRLKPLPQIRRPRRRLRPRQQAHRHRDPRPPALPDQTVRKRQTRRLARIAVGRNVDHAVHAAPPRTLALFQSRRGQRHLAQHALRTSPRIRLHVAMCRE